MKITWTTEKRKVADLKDYPKNPRIFTEKGMKDLRASFESLGYIDPIAINTDNTIIGGHARKRLLLELGLEEIEVRVPSKKLTEKQIDEAIIRLNKNTAGVWDFKVLEDSFKESELVTWGFEKSEFNRFPSKQLLKEVQNSDGFFVLLEFTSEKEQEKFYNEMTARGLKCKLMS